MSARRADRVGEAVREAIAEMLMREVKDPRIGMVTITAVTMTDDLRHGKVYFSCLGDEVARARSLAGLRSASGFIRTQLLRRLQLRYAPEMSYVFDPSVAEAERMAGLLRSAQPKGE